MPWTCRHCESINAQADRACNVCDTVRTMPSHPHHHRLAAGHGHIFVLHADKILTPLTEFDSKQLRIMADYPLLESISAGVTHAVGISIFGQIFEWDQAYCFLYNNVPDAIKDADVLSVAAGIKHTLMLTTAGTVHAWGENDAGQCNVPQKLPNIIAIASGFHSVALTAAGVIIEWGVSEVPVTHAHKTSPFVSIAAGRAHTLGLTAAGTVHGWGHNDAGQIDIPPTLRDVVLIAAGGNHSLAVTGDGRVHAWGENACGQTTVPKDLANVVEIAAGFESSMARMADDTVVFWGQTYTISPECTHS